MKQKSVLVAETDTTIHETIKKIVLEIDSEALYVEVNDGIEAIKTISDQQFTLFVANVDLPNGWKIFASIENPFYKFPSPKNYLFYGKKMEEKKTLLPQRDNVTIMEIPLEDEAVKKIVFRALTNVPQKKKQGESEKYSKIPIEIVIKFGKAFPFDIFIKVSSKVLKLSHGDEERQDQFIRYQEKGLEFVYVVKDDYLSYLNNLKNNMSSKFADPNTLQPTNDVIDTLNSCHKAVKALFSESLIPPESIELAKEVAANSLKMIEKTPNIFQFFMEFKNKCSKQFMISMITGYLTSCMIDSVDWGTSAIKEKLALAALLSDVLLEEEDFIEIREKKDDPKLLSEKVLNHPTRMVEMLSPNLETLSNEVLTIINEHHEKPDNSGYPAGLGHNQVNTLSAMYIVAFDFVCQLVERNFNFKDINVILGELGNKYTLGNYKKAYKSVSQVFTKG